MVLVDFDRAGEHKAKAVKQFNVKVHLAREPGRLDGEGSIEDVIGLAEYVRAVNEAHQGLEGVEAVTEEEVRGARGLNSLGAYFAERFGESFSKVAPSVVLAERFREAPETISSALRDLVRKLAEDLAAP